MGALPGVFFFFFRSFGVDSNLPFQSFLCLLSLSLSLSCVLLLSFTGMTCVK